MGSRLLETAAAARALGVTTATLRRRCYDGTIPYVQIGRRGRIRVAAEALLALGVPRELLPGDCPPGAKPGDCPPGAKPGDCSPGATRKKPK